MSEPIRPFFPYYGSKWNIARHYPAPTHDVVVEPFAGSAGYSLFYGVRHAVLSDIDPIIAGVWAYLIHVTPEEILTLPELPEVGDTVDAYDLPDAARWLIGFWLNRGSAQPKRTRTAYSARMDRSQLNWGARAKARIAQALPAIRGWTIEKATYLDAPALEATWFIDPPYAHAGQHYRYHAVEYAELGTWCRTRPGQVIVCENAGATWLPFTPQGSYKATRGRSAEVIWTSEVRE